MVYLGTYLGLLVQSPFGSNTNNGLMESNVQFPLLSNNILIAKLGWKFDPVGAIIILRPSARSALGHHLCWVPGHKAHYIPNHQIFFQLSECKSETDHSFDSAWCALSNEGSLWICGEVCAWWKNVGEAVWIPVCASVCRRNSSWGKNSSFTNFSAHVCR